MKTGSEVTVGRGLAEGIPGGGNVEMHNRRQTNDNILTPNSGDTLTQLIRGLGESP